MVWDVKPYYTTIIIIKYNDDGGGGGIVGFNVPLDTL